MPELGCLLRGTDFSISSQQQFVYTARSFNDIATDKEHVKKFEGKLSEWKAMTEDERKNNRCTSRPEYFHTHRTIGYVLGRWFVALCPIVNVFCAVFDCMGSMIDEIVNTIRKIFNIDIIAKPRDTSDE